VELRGNAIPPGRDLRHTRTWTRVTDIGDDAALGTLVSEATSVHSEGGI
jgi:hypothetical protein